MKQAFAAAKKGKGAHRAKTAPEPAPARPRKKLRTAPAVCSCAYVVIDLSPPNRAHPCQLQLTRALPAPGAQGDNFTPADLQQERGNHAAAKKMDGKGPGKRRQGVPQRGVRIAAWPEVWQEAQGGADVQHLCGRPDSARGATSRDVPCLQVT